MRPFFASSFRFAAGLTLTTILAGQTVAQGLAQNLQPVRNCGEDGGSPVVSSIVSQTTGEKVSVTMSTVSPSPSYVIGIGDMLHIAVWKEPDLTTTLPVRSDGMISLPLLNDVQASGLTPTQLAALLNEKLKKYVAAPNVAVVVTQTNSHRVYIVGEVLHSGPISLLQDMTVLQALSTAGLGQFANTKNIYVLRSENGQQKRLAFNYKRVIKGDLASQNIPLQAGDMIVVP